MPELHRSTFEGKREVLHAMRHQPAKSAQPRRSASAAFSRMRACLALVVLGGLGLGGCAQQPQQFAAAAGHPKEYFPSSVYGPASRRVIEDGQPVPRGGGQYLVGKPYTIAGQTYYPSERRITQVGLASWYGDAFHGRLTANGEIYDRDSFTAAHPTMPLPSYARVTNLRNNTSMIVRVNDRGPYHSNRVMDVSRRVADALDIRRYGTAKVKVEWVARASLAGSDDAKLAATLRTGGPATIDGIEEGIQVATAPARAIVASLKAFVPAPVPTRPARYVEQQRPDALETYRAPRAAPHPPRREENDDVHDARSERRDPQRFASHAPRREELDDDVSETGSMQHRGGHAARDEQRQTVLRERSQRPGSERHDDPRRDLRIAQLVANDGARSARGAQHAQAPLPPLRHANTGATGAMPAARPTRLAVLTPSAVHKRTPAARSRSHDE